MTVGDHQQEGFPRFNVPVQPMQFCFAANHNYSFKYFISGKHIEKRAGGNSVPQRYSADLNVITTSSTSKPGDRITEFQLALKKSRGPDPRWENCWEHADTCW